MGMKPSKIYIVVSDQEPEGKHVEELRGYGNDWLIGEDGRSVTTCLNDAIEAAKPSALEQWREEIDGPWGALASKMIRTLRGETFQGSNIDERNQLIIAAPQAIEKLIKLYPDLKALGLRGTAEGVAEVLRAALPEDVYREVVGDE